MKILYFNIIFLATTLTVFSQDFHPEILNEYQKAANNTNSINYSRSSGDTILINSFDNASDWTISSPDPTSSNNLQGQWQIVSTTPADVSTYMGPMASTSSSDGFAVFDVIQYLLTASVDYQDATIELNDTIDLTNYPAVSLEFEQRYKAFNYDETYIEFSTDFGQTWQGIQLNDQVATNDPAIQELVELNISSLVGGQANVKIRFRWASPTDDDSYGSGYGWMIDDLKITVPPANDIQNLSSWIFGENSFGAEYGRTPLSQVEPNYYVGAYIYNYGSADQTSISVDGTFSGPTNFTTTATSSLIQSDSSQSVESLNPMNFSVGLYSGEVTISSMGDTIGSDNFGNNSFLRNFEITNDVYSLDGIGNHPAGQESLASVGTNSFTGGEDGLVCATMYPIIQPEVINSVRAFISSTSAAGSEVILYVVDSASFRDGLFGNAIFTSDLYTVTATDISNGYIDISTSSNTGWDAVNNISTWENLIIPQGNYYAALELYSGGNTFDVRIIDDNTVGQPAWSSAIWIPGAQAYTNGNAFAIRLQMGSNVGMEEDLLDNVSIYPNPSNGIINIEFTNNQNSGLIIRDAFGKVVLKKNISSTSSIDLTSFSKGLYMIEITSNNQSIIKKLSLK
jgi:hypothetical protein